MAIARRFLPSMSLLSAFDAAARHESFTAAAGELYLTQSAISRQIKALEDRLGTELFVRERQSVRLTVAGEVYAQKIADALKRISAATIDLRANPSGGILELAILPTFGTRWLAPRLPAFLAENPGITINLTTRFETFDFEGASPDAAIHYGLPEWPGAELDLLLSETVVPAFSEHLGRTYGLQAPADLLQAPLLHLASRPDAWERWFGLKEVEIREIHGMVLDHFATAAQAAISGLGVALLPKFLIESELAKGDLVTIPNGELISAEKYYLAWPTHRANNAPLQAFRNWIKKVSSEPTAYSSYKEAWLAEPIH